MIEKNHSNKTLNYVIIDPREIITMNLYEAELYESAIIVQSLIGNLVYYSNLGRYEPRLAKSWQRTKPNTWTFELLPDLTCENGEAITPKSFKSSIERTLKYLSKNDSTPILSKLKGFKQFIEGSKDNLIGIEASENKITFVFDRPMRDGVLQILSFAPFGYISKENLNNDGSWKNNEKFLSSGAYKLSSIEIGKKYVIERNPKWTSPFHKDAPQTIIFTTSLPEELLNEVPQIIDSYLTPLNLKSDYYKYSLVPEYINPILLGNLEHGYFSNIQNRVLFKKVITKHRTALPEKWENHTRSKYFYTSQALSLKEISTIDKKLSLPQNNGRLIIEGEEPKEKSPRFYAWKVLKSALEEANLKYKFANNISNWKSSSDNSYDIRLKGSSVGGGAEAWGLDIIFCSDLGIRFPDPSGRVCNLINDFNLDRVPYTEFSNAFSRIVDEDSAIIPISHFGIQLNLSRHINSSTLSPTLCVIRFDQLGIN